MGSYSRRAYYVHGSSQVWRRRYSNVVVVVVVVNVLTELVLVLVFYAAVINDPLIFGESIAGRPK